TAGVDGFDAIIDSHDCQGADCPQIAPILDLEAAGLRQDGSIDQALAGAAADAGTNVTNMVGQANQALSDAGGNAAGDPGTDGGIGFEPGDGLLQGSSIVSVAGYLQAGQNNVGVSIAWNEIANTFSASIVDSTVEASGDTE